MAFRKLTDFIQADVITGFIQDKLYASTVARMITSNPSRATLGKGSSYKIPGTGTLTVNDYSGNTVTPQNLTSTNETIAMDQFPFVNFFLEDSDVDEATALYLAGVYAGEAGEAIAQAIDKYVLRKIKAGAVAAATGLGVTATPIQLNSNIKVLDYLQLFATTLKENNIESDVAIVVPPFMEIAVTRELGVTASNQSVSGMIEPGKIGHLFGCDIYSSTNLPAGVADTLVAGEIAVLGGKRSTFHTVEGLMIVKAGDAEGRPATWNQFGQVYGADFSNANGWYTGIVKK